MLAIKEVNMNKFIGKVMTLLMSTLLITPFLMSHHVMAHEGHDHSHLWAWLAHLVWAVSILAIAYIALLLVRSQMLNKLDKMESNDAL